MLEFYYVCFFFFFFHVDFYFELTNILSIIFRIFNRKIIDASKRNFWSNKESSYFLAFSFNNLTRSHLCGELNYIAMIGSVECSLIKARISRMSNYDNVFVMIFS